MKPKQNQKADINESNVFDRCQTPFYAMDPLLKYLHRMAAGPIWEPAQGDGHIVTKLENEGFEVIGTDILTGHNFFDYTPHWRDWDIQVTNPPYSIKYDWLRRSYELEKPFALLLPLDTLGSAKGQNSGIEKHGIEIILLNLRVHFKMPRKGYDTSGAQFPVAWFTWGLGIGRQITFGKITRYEDGQIQIPDFARLPVNSKPKQLELI